MTWGLVIKTALGNVYHLANEEGRATCNHALLIDHKSKRDVPGDDGAICGRCRNIEWHRKRKTA